jgi:hypothetical protein
MCDQPKRAHEASLRAQRVALSHVLDLHPTHASIPALVRDLVEDASDTYDRAIRDLTGIGLLHCSGGIVTPTAAALRFDCISST